jgi:predicted PurR-regulated permease PerM
MATRTAERPSNATIARIVVVVAGVLLLLYAAYLVRSVLMLVLISAFLAVGLDPAVRRLEKWGLKRGQAVAAIFLTATLLLGIFIATIVPSLVEQVTKFATDLPEYIQNIAEDNPRIQEWVEENNIQDKLKEATEKAPSMIGGSFGSVLGIAGSIVSAIFNGITILVLTIYFVLSLSRIREGSLKLVPASKRDDTKKLADPILEKIGGYIAGQATVAALAGALSLIFFFIIGLPYPIALALWVTIAALIPLVGATLGAIPAVIVAFFDSTGVGLATLVFYVVYQQVENYVIAPRIMNKAVDVSPAAVLLAALIGGSLLGFVGALMAIPAAASLKLIVQEVIQPKLDKA